MSTLTSLLNSEALSSQPIAGLSLGFILIFFAPLALVAVGFLIYCIFARRSVVRAAKVLSLLWCVACIPASLMIFMGYAFNPSGKNPFIQIPAWIAVGLVAIWLPVGLRKLFGAKPA
jgi:hypothetical protein